MRRIINDSQALVFVQGQAHRINATVYGAIYPDWDFSRLMYVNTEGNPWAPGVVTYTSDFSGEAKFQSGYAKDVPLADVSQDYQLKTHFLAAIGYQYNIEEVNAALQVDGALPDRRARAARLVYQKFMYETALVGKAEKGWRGLINQAGVTATQAAGTGDSSPTSAWILNNGTINKTPDEIIADLNFVLTATSVATLHTVIADTILMPTELFQHIASTPRTALSDTTILTWYLANNPYTATTSRPLRIMAVPELRTAATVGVSGGGRIVAYRNEPTFIQLHLPMPHQFLPVYQDGPLNWMIPGIFRTGGVEVMATQTLRYLDGVMAAPG